MGCSSSLSNAELKFQHFGFLSTLFLIITSESRVFQKDFCVSFAWKTFQSLKLSMFAISVNIIISIIYGFLEFLYVYTHTDTNEEEEL